MHLCLRGKIFNRSNAQADIGREEHHSHVVETLCKQLYITNERVLFYLMYNFLEIWLNPLRDSIVRRLFKRHVKKSDA